MPDQPHAMGHGMDDELSLWSRLERRVDATPDAVMVATATEQLTFAEVQRRALSMAGRFVDLGVGPGTTVSWQLPTWADSVVVLVALSRLGAIQNPLLTLLREREVGFITNQVGADLLVVPGTWRGFDHLAMATNVTGPDTGVMVLRAGDTVVPDTSMSNGPVSSEPVSSRSIPPAPTDPSLVRWLYSTSGTTAAPKTARHTDATIGAAARCMTEHLEIGPADRIACVFPFAHIAGAVYVLTSLQSGCSMALVDSFDPTTSPGVLRDLDVTLVGAGTPFHQAYLAYQDDHPELRPLFPRARAFLGGGAPTPRRLHERVRDELGGGGITSGYGLTEAPILTMGRPTDDDQELATTEGRPGSGVELRFVGPDGTDDPAGEGEILVRAPQLMLGYVDETLDDDAFVDGWFRTGDLGHLSEAGNLVVSGRAKDVIIRNMENLSAKEIEDVIGVHPAVSDVAVIGLPDGRTGEQVCAVVVASDEGAVTLAELARFVVEQGLSIQKAPERIEFVDALPRNDTGKVQKFVLRQRYRDEH